MNNPQWITEGHPESEDIFCVVLFESDYWFAYWIEGVNCWDCADYGFMKDTDVQGWYPLPDILF